MPSAARAKRSSYYSDFTFGCWSEDGELLPVGKAYFGFTDEELKWLDRWVRGHTVQRFGPVREVEKSLVLEVAFEFDPPEQAPQVGPGHALPADQPDPQRQAGRRGRPDRDAAWRWRPDEKAPARRSGRALLPSLLESLC